MQHAIRQEQDSSSHDRCRTPLPPSDRHGDRPLLKPKFEDVHTLAPQWQPDDHYLHTQNDRGFPLPRLLVDTAFARRVGISDMPVHMVPVVALAPNSAQAWIVRLIAAGRPIVLEVFRARQESLLASFIIMMLRKGADNFDVGDILKALHDADSVNTEGPKDMSLWSYRSQLLQHVADAMSRVIHGMMDQSPQTTGRTGLLQEMQRLREENDQLRAAAGGAGTGDLLHPLAPANPPPDEATQLRTAFEAYERRDRRTVLSNISNNAPKSGTTADVKKWLDSLIKNHKEAFTAKHTALQKLVKDAEGGRLPPLDRTLVGWGLSVAIASKLR